MAYKYETQHNAVGFTKGREGKKNAKKDMELRNIKEK